MNAQEKLNNIAAGIKNGKLSSDWVAVDSKEILAIAEAFRALEQRAEAAEAEAEDTDKTMRAYSNQLVKVTAELVAAQAKLEDLLKRGADYIRYECRDCGHESLKYTTHCKNCGRTDIAQEELFTRAAPAAELAELVPGDISLNGAVEAVSNLSHESFVGSYQDGWNACRAAILRNIEEAK